MEQDFQTVLIRVLIIGFTVLGAGTVALVVAFRAFGGKTERKGVILLAAALAIIGVACLVLLRWSSIRQ
jgi:hypothetical protein